MNTDPSQAQLRNRRWLLARRPTGAVVPEDFRLDEVPVPSREELSEGQVLVRHAFLSLDPYMRGRMDESKSYAASQVLGEVMIGGTVGEVVASRHERWKPGDAVVGMGGWQEYATVDGRSLAAVDPGRVPLSGWLGVAGMPGVTAWYGVNHICKPEAGQTLVVTAASGAVGSVVGQLARLRGARAVGLAGGPEKCAYVREVLKFDACIDYRASDWYAQLKAATPDGVDAVFENVGGEIFDALLRRMNPFGRIAVCGLISGYNGEAMPINNLRSILVNRLSIRGFIVSDHADVWPAAVAELSGLVASGELRYRESIAQGIGAAPEAFIGLLKGQNFGKQLVRL